MRTCRLLLLTLVAAGCGSSTSDGAPAPPRTIRVEGTSGTAVMAVQPSTAPGVVVIPATLERVWSVLPAVYDSLQVPVSRLDNAQFFIAAEGFRIRRRLAGVPLMRYFDCGASQGGPNAETYELHISLSTRLQPATTGGTAASTSVTATARPVSFAGDPVACASNGRLESRVGELIRLHLRPGSE